MLCDVLALDLFKLCTCVRKNRDTETQLSARQAVEHLHGVVLTRGRSRNIALLCCVAPLPKSHAGRSAMAQVLST